MIADVNNQKINEELINKLIPFLLTSEEIAKKNQIINELEKEKAQINFEKEETLSLELMKIKDIKLKLESLKALCRIEFDVIPTIEPYFKRAEEAVSEVEQTDVLKQILGYTLKVGNIINTGSQFEKTEGFETEKLWTISFHKDAKNRDAFAVVLEQFLKNNPNFRSFQEKFPKILNWEISLFIDENQMEAPQGLYKFMDHTNKDFKTLEDFIPKIEKMADADFKKKILPLINKVLEVKKPYEKRLEVFIDKVIDLSFYYTFLRKTSSKTDSKTRQNAEKFIAYIKKFVIKADMIIKQYKLNTVNKANSKEKTNKFLINNSKSSPL